MADNKKEVLFTFKVDQTSLNNLKNAIRSITADMNALIKTAAGISRLGGGAPAVGGGGAVSAQGMDTAIRTASNKPGQNSGLGGVFNTAGAAATSSAADIKRATRSIEADVRALQQALRAPMGGAVGGIFDRAANRINQPQMPPPLPMRNQGGGGAWSAPWNAPGAPSWGSYMPQSGGPLLPGISPGGPFGPNIAGPGMAWGAPPPPAPPPAPVNWAKVGVGVAAAAAVLTTGYSELNSQFRDQSYVAGIRGSMADRQIRALKAHDFSLSYTKNTLSNDEKAILLNETSGMVQGGKWVGGVTEAGSKVIKSVPVAGKLAQFFGATNDSHADRGILFGTRYDVQQTEMTQEGIARLEEMKSARFMETQAMEEYGSTRFSRVRAQRLGLARGTGAVDPKTGLPTNSYGDTDTRLARGGYNWAGKMGAYEALRSGAGVAFARRHHEDAMRANEAGYGGWSPLMALAARAGGSNSRFAKGAIGGGMDPLAGMGLGQTILGSGYDPRGTTSGVGLLTAFQLGGGGVGGPGDFNRVAALAGGMELGNSILGGGFSPYQAGRNLIGAIDAKPGGGFYAQDALASGMNLRQMADAIKNNEVTASMAAHGISIADVKNQFGVATAAAFDSFRDQRDGSSMSRSINAMRASGKTPGEYVASLSGTAQEVAIRDLGVYLGERKGGGGAEAGQALIRVQAGLATSGTLSEGLLKTGFSGLEKTSAEADAKFKQQDSDTLVKIYVDFKKTIEGAKLDADNWKTIGANLHTSARNFITNLTNMNEAMVDAIAIWKNLDVGYSGPRRATAGSTGGSLGGFSGGSDKTPNHSGPGGAGGAGGSDGSGRGG